MDKKRRLYQWENCTIHFKQSNVNVFWDRCNIYAISNVYLCETCKHLRMLDLTIDLRSMFNSSNVFDINTTSKGIHKKQLKCNIESISKLTLKTLLWNNCCTRNFCLSIISIFVLWKLYVVFWLKMNNVIIYKTDIFLHIWKSENDNVMKGEDS